mgnify:CR=1 FL=1
MYARDPLLHGLIILERCIREEAADVLENFRVEDLMMCIVALQALDKRMVKVYNKTSTSREKQEQAAREQVNEDPFEATIGHGTLQWRVLP